MHEIFAQAVELGYTVAFLDDPYSTPYDAGCYCHTDIESWEVGDWRFMTIVVQDPETGDYDTLSAVEDLAGLTETEATFTVDGVAGITDEYILDLVYVLTRTLLDQRPDAAERRAARVAAEEARFASK